ncbi:MAG: hypothetical protein GWQ05_09725 [Verrucomicrobiaceae bacterium]|nr:hypothetical protein [Verrucomicrobiaceae bacterium]NCF91222.1 hypothetical protein [Verrucomicrobiaceae bacterium]
MNRRLHILFSVTLSGVFTTAGVVGPRWAAKDKTRIDAGIAALGFFLLCAILALLVGLYALVAAI